MTYYRVQTSDRDPTDLLDADYRSATWRDELDSQEGVSVCESREALADYLATGGQGIPIGTGDWVLVELEGHPIFARARDADYGELLIRPTRVVSTEPLGDVFYAMIGAAFDALADQ